MKKHTLLSAALMLLMGGAAHAQWFVASQALSSDDVLSFAVISDTHVENNNGVGAKVKVPRALKSLTSKRALDAFIVVGDLSNNGYLSEYQTFAEYVSADSNFINPVGKKIFLMGNHDNYSSDGQANYASALAGFNGGENYPLDQYQVINGYPFITISQRNSSNTDAYYESYGTAAYPEDVCNQLAEWMAKAAEECPGKPIFVFTHVPPTNTMYSAWTGEGSGVNSPNWAMRPLGAVLAKYPQAIVFSGHSHFPIGDPRSIHQGVDPTSSRNNYYTAIGTGSSTYSEIETGKVDEGIHPSGYTQVTEGLIVTVQKNGNVVVRRYDTYRDNEIQPETPWTIAAPFDGSTFQYADIRDSLELKDGQTYRTGLPAPVFADGAALSITEEADGASITYPQATDNDCVFRYKTVVKNSYGRVVNTYWTFSKFFLGADMPDSITTKVTGLEPTKSYTVEVTAYDSYNNASSTTLKGSFTLPEDTDPTHFAPDPVADWTFDGDEITTNSVENSEYSMETASESGTTVTPGETAGIKFMEGPKDGNGAVFMPKAAALQITRTSADTVSTYSIMYDVRVSATNVYHALLQTDPDNYNDADFFINKSAKVGLSTTGFSYGGTIKADTWHRIVFVVENGVPRAYIDGSLVVQGTAAQSRWMLTGDKFFFFCDNSGEDADIDVAEVKMWHTALTDKQVYNLGKIGTNAYMKTSTPEVEVVDSELQFDLVISSSVEPTFDLPEWIHAVQATPMVGDDITYTFVCDSLEEGADERADNVYVFAPEGSDLEMLEIPVVQMNRGDVVNDKKWADFKFNNSDDLLANSMEESDLSFTVGTEGSNSFTECEFENSGITAAEGPNANTSAVFIPATTALKLINGNAEEHDTYTYMYDLKLSKAGWFALYSDDITNATDADLFIKPDATIGLNTSYLGYGGNVTAGVWHRIVVVVRSGAVTLYVDGTKVKEGTTGASRWNLHPEGALLFADNNSEDNDIYVSRIAFWNEWLTQSQVQSLGKVGE